MRTKFLSPFLAVVISQKFSQFKRQCLSLTASSDEEADNARKALAEGLTAVSRLFDEMPYFLSEDFTLVDCYLAPLLWRLDVLGVKLPPRASAIQGYLDRVFVRDGFMASLSEAERELRA